MPKKIHVTAAPGGHAPGYVQVDWIGLHIPINEEAVKLEMLESGVWGSSTDDSYYVMAEDAIAALRAADRNRSAHYWEYTAPTGVYRFKKTVCQLIEA